MEPQHFELNDKVKVIAPDIPLTGYTGMVSSIVYRKGSQPVYDIGVDISDIHNRIDVTYFKPEQLQKLCR